MTTNELSSISRKLVDVAMGRSPAELVIKNGHWVCVQSGEIVDHTDIAVMGQLIAYVGPDASHTVGDETTIVEAENQYMVPGFLDGHMHVESGMLTITEFVRAVIPHGTTGMFIDPHEIANVFGLKGVRLMVDEAEVQPIHVWVQMPSCVPSAPGLETPGAAIGPREVAEAMGWKGIIGLGEMMNFPGVYSSDEKMHAEMAVARQAGKVIGGHYASMDLDLPFHGYVAGGAEDDHEGTRLEDAVMRVRQGMKAMLRCGSGWRDVAAQIPAITQKGLSSRYFILCTDDSHPATLVNDGHVNQAIKQAMSHGVPPITAIQMATINTSEHFGLSRQVGLIAPGRYADILLIPELTNLFIDMVIAKGNVLAQDGRLSCEIPAYSYPKWVKKSVRVGHILKEADFKFVIDGDGVRKANVIGVIENQAPTRHLLMDVIVENGDVKINLDRDITKVAVVERHQGTGRVQLGLVHGFGFRESCAVASTVAHDSHHLIVVGTNEKDMATAANVLARVGGGQIVVRNGKVIGLVELPIAGLMSNERVEIVVEKVKTILDGFQTCGSRLNNPIMQLSLLALVVIPELRLSDLGLVDVTKFEFIPVIEKLN